MHNSKYHCQMAACCTDPRRTYLAAKQEQPHRKAYFLTKNIEEISGKKFRRMSQQAEKDQTERVTGLGRRTREETVKWNQTTVL